MSTESKPFPPTLSGQILLSDCFCDWDVFKLQFYDDWKIELEAEPNFDHLAFNLGDATIVAVLIDDIVPEAIETTDNDYLWENAELAISMHQAHIILGVIGAENPLQRHILFSMTAASLLKQPGAIGLFQYPVTRNAANYIDGAMSLLQDNIPVTNWIYVGFYQGEEGLLSSYTYGLDQFGREEIEIINSRSDMISIYQFLYQLLGCLITQGETLEPGESIGFSPEESYAVTLSEGAVMQGMTIKIDF